MFTRIKYLIVFYRYGIIRLFFDLVYTKLFYQNSRIIRRPIEIRGSSNIKFGVGLTTGRYCRIEAYKNDFNIHSLVLGDNIQINDSVHIDASLYISIANNCLISSRVYITDSDHGIYAGENEHSSPNELAKDRQILCKETIIEENCWIGYNPIYTQIIYVKPLLFTSNISTHSFQFDNLCLKLQ